MTGKNGGGSSQLGTMGEAIHSIMFLPEGQFSIRKCLVPQFSLQMAAVFPAAKRATEKNTAIYANIQHTTSTRATFASGAQQKMQIGIAMLCSTHLSFGLELRRAVSAGLPHDGPHPARLVWRSCNCHTTHHRTHTLSRSLPLTHAAIRHVH
jgi:hypothetical protein